MYKPTESRFRTYGDYALAALGYALFSEGVGILDSTRADDGAVDGGVPPLAICTGAKMARVVGSMVDGSGLPGCGCGSGVADSGLVNDPDVCKDDLPRIHVEKERDQVGSGDDVRSCLGETKQERNRRWRREKAQRKKDRQLNGVDWRSGSSSTRVDDDLRISSAVKWKVQNELAAEKARRELEILKASDLDQEIRRYRTKVSAHTERNMVSIEKTHAYLKNTGNVPGVAPVVVPGLDHDVHTVSDTISPDSSASQHEFRMCQKRLLDSEKKIADFLKVFEKLGISSLVAENFDKETFTDDTAGNEIYQEMHGDMPDVIHHVVRDGKRKFKVGLDPECY